MSVPRVLLVEEDRRASKLLSYKLSAHGYQVHTAYDTREAAEITQMASPHLVILDLGTRDAQPSSGNRPGGFGYLEWLNENVVTNRPAVIVLSSWSPLNAAPMARKLGAVVYLQKPADEKLFAIIEILLGNKSIPPPPDSTAPSPGR